MSEPTTETPSWDIVRERINQLAEERGEWGGYPMPLPGLKLTVEPRHPLAQTLNNATIDVELTTADGEPLTRIAADLAAEFKVRNRWWSFRESGWVYVYQKPSGGVGFTCSRDGLPMKRMTIAINTLGVASSVAWSVEAECRALEKLQLHVGDHKFKQYLMTGMFFETSLRSKVSYLFRKLRPTVALTPNPQTGGMRVLCCLCLHPLGYYQESWGGVMVPTDCVIAHLLMMRADEHYYWRKANQHPPWAPEAGL